MMIKQARTSRKLTSELERLKRIFDLGRELRVAWIPGYARYVHGRKVIGEVLGGTIYIYAEKEATALEVLHHEFIEEILLEKFTIPYKRTINLLLAALEEQIYSEKEKLVKKLTHLIWRDDEKEASGGGGK